MASISKFKFSSLSNEDLKMQLTQNNEIKFPHSPILRYAFTSWIEKTITKTIHFHWENRFVLQWYGAVWKFYPAVNK